MDFPAARHSLLKFDLFDGILPSQRSFQEYLVPLKFLLVGLLTELLFSGIVLYELDIALSIEQESLLVVLLLLLLFDRPLIP